MESNENLGIVILIQKETESKKESELYYRWTCGEEYVIELH